MRYRRHFSPGGSYFFTVVTQGRRRILTTPHSIANLRNAFRKVMRNHPFTLDAIVVLPDHLHCIWTLPQDDESYPTRWRLVKTEFTKRYWSNPNTRNNPWQPRYWEHTLRNEEDRRNHLDYIHYNPVKHGYVERVREWPHSSFHRFVAAGIYAEHWGSDYHEALNTGHE